MTLGQYQGTTWTYQCQVGLDQEDLTWITLKNMIVCYGGNMELLKIAPGGVVSVRTLNLQSNAWDIAKTKMMEKWRKETILFATRTCKHE